MRLAQVGSRYRVLETLGEGGSGCVYRAQDRSTGEEVALKVLRLDAGAEGDATTSAALRAGKEFRLLASHSHPHLVRVFDYGRVPAQDGAPELAYFSMELVRGRSLLAFVADERAAAERAAAEGAEDGAPSERLLRVFRQILEALDYIHTRGILHLDLKPANILVVPGSEPTAKLLDFGLAELRGGGGDATLSGTVEYLAPERILQKGCDARSDLYALGVTLFEVLTGACPFAGDDPAAVMAAHLHTAPPEPERLPSALRGPVLRLLEKDPTRRPRSARAALVELLGAARATDPTAVLGTTVVGRDELLATLGRPPSAGDRPRTRVVRGPVGIGKSRLLRELEVRFELAGTPVVLLRCGGCESTARALLELVAATEAVAASAALRRRMQELAEGLSKPPSFEPGASGREALLHGVSSALLDVAREAPLVVLLDEFERADPVSREALLTLVRAAEYSADAALLLVLSTRDGSLDDLAVVTALERATPSFRSVETHRLEALDADAVEAYLEQIFGRGGYPEELSAWLLAQTGGNPYFLEELLKQQLESGGLKRAARGWKLATGATREADLPTSIEEALSRRLERVHGRALDVLQWLAVFDRPVSVGDVRPYLSGEDVGQDLDGLFDRLAREGLLARDGAKYYFPHASLQAVLYRGLGAAERVRRHDAVADELQRESGRSGGNPAAELVEALAHHHYAGSYPQEAHPFLLLASVRALATGALWAAERDLQRAVEVSPTPAQRFEGLCSLASVQGQLGQREAQDETLRSLDRLAGDPRAESTWPRQVSLSRADRFESEGRHAEALEELERALAQPDSEPDATARLRVRVGLLQLYEGDFDACEATLKQVLTTAVEVDNDSLKADCLQFLGLADYRRGRRDEAVRRLRAALALLRDLGAEAKLGAVTSNLGLVHLDRGDYEAAEEQFNASLAVFRRSGMRRGESVNLLNLGLTYLEMGRPERALGVISEALAIRRELGDRRGEGSGMGNLGAVWLKLGRVERAVPLLEAALLRARELGNRQSESVNESRLGVQEVERGGAEAGLVRLEKGLAIASELGLAQEQILAHQGLAQGYLATASLARACEHAEQALELAAKNGFLAQEISSRAMAGAARRVAGELAQAERLSAAATAALEAFRGWYGDAHLIWLERYRTLEACRTAVDLAEKELSGGQLPSESECEAALRRAYSLLREKSDAFEDGELRDGYLASIPEHAEINRLHQTLQSRTRKDEARRERSFHEIARSIHSILELDPLLDRLLELAIETTHAEKGLILLKDPRGDFTTRAARGMARESVEDAKDICRSVIADVAQGAQPVLATDAGSDARFRDRQSIISFQIRTLMCVPLVVRDEIIGAVYVDGRGVQSFARADLDYMVSFAQLAAIAVENVRLFEDLRAENQGLRRQVESRYRFENLIAESAVMVPVLDVMAKVAHTSASIFLSGETGTGKEVIARAIHYASDRRSRPFVAVDCGALPENLLESELFGHRRGAFSGAVHDRVGLFEEADGGTLFLDEITNTSLDVQAKLLRVLQEGEVRRVGENQMRKVDVRVLAATNVNAADAVAEGRFREDLFYRLNVVAIEVPPLRKRSEDIPLLATHFLERSAQRHAAEGEITLAPQALRLLLELPWRGNVRELENFMEKAVILAESPRLSATFVESLLSPSALAGRRPPAAAAVLTDPPPDASEDESAPATGGSPPAVPTLLPLEAFDRDWREAERSYLLALVEGAGWNLSEAARRAQVRNRNTLVSRLKKHGIERRQ